MKILNVLDGEDDNDESFKQFKECQVHHDDKWFYGERGDERGARRGMGGGRREEGTRRARRGMREDRGRGGEEKRRKRRVKGTVHVSIHG